MNTESAPHILLIDDEAIALSNLRHVFEREGYVVTACKSGEAGLAAMQAEQFDLVLTDLRMPGIDGMEVLAHIRATTPDVPVIMITAYGDADTKRKALEGGAEALFTKPIDFGALRSEITTRVERAA